MGFRIFSVVVWVLAPTGVLFFMTAGIMNVVHDKWAGALFAYFCAAVCTGVVVFSTVLIKES